MKNTKTSKAVALVLVLAMLLMCVCTASADGWKPRGRQITIRVSNTAGGQADLIMRKVAAHVQSVTGVPTVVSNITGASGFLMANDLDEYDPDICELMVGTEALFAIAPLFNDKIKISLDDYIALYGSDTSGSPSTLAVPAGLGVKTWEEFVEYAKNNRILCASNQPGTLTHMNATALFGSAGIEFGSVTDSGGNKNVLSVLNGDANCVIVNTGVLHDYVEKGDLVPLVTFNGSTYTDWDLDPIPSVADIGYPEIVMESCNIVCCRAGVDQADVDALGKIIVDYLTSEQGIADMAEINSTPNPMDAETAVNRLKHEIETTTYIYNTFYNK